MNISQRDLHRENIHLRHRLDTLLAELERRGDPLPCDLTKSQAILACMLRSRSPSIVTREAMHASLYAFRSEAEEPALGAVDVLLYHTRRQLSAAGISFRNDHGRGWYMPPGDAAKWDRAVNARKMR